MLRALVVSGERMSKKQSRRSVSITGELYDRLKAWCEVNNRSMSSVVEESIGPFLNIHRGRPIERNGNVFTF
jgi:hypothetical protein